MNSIILMADIIDSRKKDSKKTILDFSKMVDAVNEKFKKEILSPLTITLGDEFQGVLKSEKAAKEILFFFEESIITKNLKFKLRYVINFGQIETNINKKNSYKMLGSGLTQTRESLNEIKKTKSRFAFLNFESNFTNDLCKLLQSFIDSWTLSDMKFVVEFLNNKTYQEVASKLNINVASAWKRYKNLKMDEYFICKKLILNQ